MAIHIRDPDTDAVVRRLARRRGVGITEAVKLAAEAELRRDADDIQAALRDVQAEVAARGRSGLKADKAFFDDLSGQGD